VFILKKSIQSELNKAQKNGFEEGLQHSYEINELEKAKIKNKYESEILQLKSELYIKDVQIKDAISMKSKAIKKDRKANDKMIQAQNIVLQVKQVLSNIGESVVRGKTDIKDISLKIDTKVQEVLKIEESTE
jgi:hypothetical protein